MCMCVLNCVRAGYTLTSRILLLDVLRVIKSHGFSATKEPLILSFENHCGVVAQDRIADMIENVLGDLVLRESAHLKAMPSPKDVSYCAEISGRAFLLYSPGVCLWMAAHKTVCVFAVARARADQRHLAGVVAFGE